MKKTHINIVIKLLQMSIKSFIPKLPWEIRLQKIIDVFGSINPSLNINPFELSYKQEKLITFRIDNSNNCDHLLYNCQDNITLISSKHVYDLVVLLACVETTILTENNLQSLNCLIRAFVNSYIHHSTISLWCRFLTEKRNMSVQDFTNKYMNGRRDCMSVISLMTPQDVKIFENIIGILSPLISASCEFSKLGQHNLTFHYELRRMIRILCESMHAFQCLQYLIDNKFYGIPEDFEYINKLYCNQPSQLKNYSYVDSLLDKSYSVRLLNHEIPEELVAMQEMLSFVRKLEKNHPQFFKEKKDGLYPWISLMHKTTGLWNRREEFDKYYASCIDYWGNPSEHQNKLKLFTRQLAIEVQKPTLSESDQDSLMIPTKSHVDLINEYIELYQSEIEGYQNSCYKTDQELFDKDFDRELVNSYYNNRIMECQKQLEPFLKGLEYLSKWDELAKQYFP